MCINLNVIVSYIDCYSDTYFDIKTYECFYEYQVYHTELNLLKIPKVDELRIISSYIESSNNKLLQNTFRYKFKVNINSFHIIINSLQLYDDWIEFRYNFLLQEAKRWCEDNNIIYTSKTQI